MELNKINNDSFAKQLLIEWTKFRKGRRWVIGMVIAALVIVLPGLFIAVIAKCQGPKAEICPSLPLGPNGKAVSDRFYFVHQPLNGDGSITVRLTSMTGLITYPPPNHNEIVPGVVPWAKAGVIIKESTKQGTPYAALMLTGSHGVRMQYNFVVDAPGLPGGVSMESPRWLQLTRSGDMLSGYELADGTQWTRVGTAQLDGLPARVLVGFFVTSPGNVTVSEGAIRFTNATAVFDHITLQGASSSVWSSDDIGAQGGLPDYLYGKVVEKSGGVFTVTGAGDIAPLGADGGWPFERILIGTLLGLIVVIVVAVSFATSDFRKNLIEPAQPANPLKDQVLLAKAVVMGMVTLVAGLVATITTISLGNQFLVSNGNPILPVTALTEWRVILGTAALLIAVSIFSLALGALFRSNITAMTISIALVAIPYILAFTNTLPLVASQWLLRLTPAAGFAIQQSIPEYSQVIGLYIPQLGYYPLSPWAGFTVLCGYTAFTLGLAVLLLRRRD